MSNDNNNTRSFRFPSGALGDLPAFGMSDHEYTEQLLNGGSSNNNSSRRQPKQQTAEKDNSPLGTRSLRAYIEMRLDMIRPKLSKLENRNHLQMMLGKPEVSDIGEVVTCPLCQQFQTQDYTQLKDHVEAHREIVELKARLKKSQEIVAKLKSDRQVLEHNLAQTKEQQDHIKDQIWLFENAGIHNNDSEIYIYTI